MEADCWLPPHSVAQSPRWRMSDASFSVVTGIGSLVQESEWH